MQYRCEATSVQGFIQQVAANYLPHGYWFWISGIVPPKKDPATIDSNLMAKYCIALSRQQRARRKAAGLANVHYIRYERFWVMLATHGRHPWFVEHSRIVVDERTNKESVETLFRDVRKAPIMFAGHSIGYKQGDYLRREGKKPAEADHQWRSRVQIQRDKYTELVAYFLDVACRRSADSLGRELFTLPFEPYAPVRQQLLNLLRLINNARHAAGLERLSPEVLRYQRKIVKPFETIGAVTASASQWALSGQVQRCSKQTSLYFLRDQPQTKGCLKR
jgi:hypothetical protein